MYEERGKPFSIHFPPWLPNQKVREDRLREMDFFLYSQSIYVITLYYFIILNTLYSLVHPKMKFLMDPMSKKYGLPRQYKFLNDKHLQENSLIPMLDFDIAATSHCKYFLQEWGKIVIIFD